MTWRVMRTRMPASCVARMTPSIECLSTCAKCASWVVVMPILEMLRSGITTTQDAHFAHVDKHSIDGVIRATQDAGIRVRMTRQVINDDDTSPANYHEDLDTALREVERVKKQWE